jgi:two-component system sensor histidine kinase PilS (NtrC family)
LSPSPLIDRFESIPRRELYFFNLYRVLEAGIVAALVFSPLAELIGEARSPALGGAVAVAYMVAAVILLLLGRNERWLVPLVFCGTCIDILAATLATHALPSVAAGIAMMLLFNVAAAAMLLPLRFGMAVACLASLALVLEYFWSSLASGAPPRSIAELSMFVTSYLALAWLGHQIGHRARSSQRLAERRTAEVANLVEINELIIRRMRTGVLVVDADNRITLANEAASLLLADGAETQAGLNQMAPELARRLQRWRGGWQVDDTPLQLFPDQPEVQPRFARLLADSDLTLVFLDDTTVVSRRAESLTLAALGRFSASLAHEIRNPLAAINYAVQLLEESRNVDDADRRLLQIIHQQCLRTNGIVESVLGLARRERANPENLDLGAFVRRFVEDYRQTLSIETDSLEAIVPAQPVQALVDPRHLQQILTALVHNALKYGRIMDEPSRVRLRVFQDGRNAYVDVLDRGPGIPEGVVAQLFRPFFTTSEHGTGLGLYIARELTRANQAGLDYVPVPGGGACFRVALAGPNAILSL